MSAATLDDVERRVLGHLPAWRSAKDAAEAARLERDGHSDAEIKKLLASPTTAKQLADQGLDEDPDEREGTDEDPRIIHGCGYTITSYTVPELTERLRRDDHLPLYLAKRIIEQGGDPRPLDEDLVLAELQALEKRKLAERSTGADGETSWTMTRAGLGALTAEVEGS
jgi:hypothetical protein